MERDNTAQIIKNLQKQIDALSGKDEVTYPAGKGEYVLLPADETGKRLIKIVPNGTLAIANLFANKGVEAYVGEIPQCGFIMDERKHRAYTPAPVSPKDAQADVSIEQPADFATNKPKALDSKERIAVISAAILGLTKEDFTQTHGYPSIKSLTTIVGFDVETKDRDAAWEAFKKSQPNWVAPDGKPTEETAPAE